MNPSYRSLCSKNTPPGKWLFGAELPKQIKEIAEVNKMANKLGPSQTSPGTRRGDRRNTSGRGSTFNQGSRPKSIFFRLKESQQHHSQQEGSQEQPTFLDSYKAALLPVEVGAYAGNLANFLLSWRSITSDPWVLEAVSGYHLEFCTKPVQTKLPNPPILSVADKEIIDEELHKLLHKGAIEQAPYCKDQFISNMFLVPKKTGDLRPVINLKSLNEFVEKIHFKMENIDMVKNLTKPGNYLASIDFKDAYFSVPIWQPHRKYLRFFWNNQTFQFACLPFGYSLAPRVFTKLLKPVTAHTRYHGVRLVSFIHDILIIGHNHQECLEHVSFLKNLLTDLGFIVNTGKSNLEPSQSLIFLGFIVNSQKMLLILPDHKVLKIKNACQSILKQKVVSLSDVAHVTGHLVSAFPAINYLELYYKSIEFCKSHQLHLGASFDDTVTLSDQAKLDLAWVIDNLGQYNGKYLHEMPISLFIESDASNTGWGAHCNGVATGGQWSRSEIDLHINHLELLAAFYALQSFVPQYKSAAHIRLKVDNSTAVACINNFGSIRSPFLNTLSRTIWDWCISRKIHISAVSIPGVDNTVADVMSRQNSDKLEWALNFSVFQRLSSLVFKPDIDLFASRLNKQLPVLYLGIQNQTAML